MTEKSTISSSLKDKAGDSKASDVGRGGRGGMPAALGCLAGFVMLVACSGGGGGGGDDPANVTPAGGADGTTEEATSSMVIDEKFEPTEASTAPLDTSMSAEDKHALVWKLYTGELIYPPRSAGLEWIDGPSTNEGAYACKGSGTLVVSQGGQIIRPGSQVELVAGDIEFDYRQCQEGTDYGDGKVIGTHPRYGANPRLESSKFENYRGRGPGYDGQTIVDRTVNGVAKTAALVHEEQGRSVNVGVFEPGFHIKDEISGATITASGESRQGRGHNPKNPIDLLYAESFKQRRYNLNGTEYVFDGTTVLEGTRPPPYTAGSINITTGDGKLLGRILYDGARDLGVLYFDPGNGPVRSLMPNAPAQTPQ